MQSQAPIAPGTRTTIGTALAGAAECRIPWRRMAIATSLAVTDVGAGSPVLLVHGQPGSRADWLGLVPLLSGDHRVLSVDRPGYGESGAQRSG